MGQYIENIGDISSISIYRYRYHIGTLDIGFFDISISYRCQSKAKQRCVIGRVSGVMADVLFYAASDYLHIFLT